MANMKFKVGDKVKVVGKRTDNYCFIRDIFMGEELTINAVNPNPINHDPHYGVEGKGVVVYEEELELVEAKPFTKDDLKDGMVVEQRDGDRYMVLGSHTIIATGYNRLSDLNDDLIDVQFKRPAYDIVKVYEIINKDSVYRFDDIFEDCHLKLIWERKEDYKEMTVEEIEKELGYKVKVVGNE